MRLMLRVLLFPIWLALGYILGIGILGRAALCRLVGWSYETGACGFYVSLFVAPAAALVFAVLMTLLIGRKPKSRSASNDPGDQGEAKTGD